MPSNFRDFIRPSDDPRVQGLSELDAYTHADRILKHPVAHKLFDHWRDLYEKTDFVGITTGGQLQPNLFSLREEGGPTLAAVVAVNRLLEHITDEQRLVIQHDLNARQWRAWMNPEVYMMRFGLRLDEVTAEVRDLVLAVLRSSLSTEGYDRARALMKINHFLGELVGAPRVLNEFSYNFNLFGSPSASEPWGWNFYGHHLCLNCRFIGTQMVITPVFMGAEPHMIDVGPLAGRPVFEQEERLALSFIRTLPPSLQNKAWLYREKRDPLMPSDRVAFGDELILAGAFQDNRVIPYEGLCASVLNNEQRQRLLQLVKVYLSYMPDGPREAKLKEFVSHIESTWFCWIGGIDDESPFYYRIQSPVLIIEFDHHAGVFLGNTTPEKFHVHTLVRTPNGNDYGMELVRQHCQCLGNRTVL